MSLCALQWQHSLLYVSCCLDPDQLSHVHFCIASREPYLLKETLFCKTLILKKMRLSICSSVPGIREPHWQLKGKVGKERLSLAPHIRIKCAAAKLFILAFEPDINHQHQSVSIRNFHITKTFHQGKFAWWSDHIELLNNPTSNCSNWGRVET